MKIVGCDLHTRHQEGGPRKLGVPHSIAFCVIEWGRDACGTLGW